jgi:hypothetical protein
MGQARARRTFRRVGLFNYEASKIRRLRFFSKRLHLIGVFLFVVSISGSLQVMAQEEPPFQDMLINAVIDKKVQSELDLIPEQREELKQISKNLRQHRSDMSKDLKTFSNSGVSEREIELRRRDLADQFEEKKQEAHSRVTGLLLPHQVDRLKQVTVQLVLKQVARKTKISSGILAPQILSYLEVDDNQAKRLESKANELQQRIAKEIQRLTSEAREELMDELTPEQRDKYKKLVGEPVKEKN